MPVFLDVHESLGDATPEDIAAAHARDLANQEAFGVRWLSYWFNDAQGKSFCLVEAPAAEDAIACHKAAHGLVPHRIIEASGDSMARFFGEWELNDVDRALHPSTSEPDTGLRAIMFTDIVGSTTLSTTSGDEALRAVVRAHDELVRAGLSDHGGREVKHTGDGILASFSSASSAVACASDIVAQAETVPDLELRLGISAGEPLTEAGDLFGAAVNLAARLCDRARPGETLVSSAVRDLVVGKTHRFSPAGDLTLKGFDQPVPSYRVEAGDR